MRLVAGLPILKGLNHSAQGWPDSERAYPGYRNLKPSTLKELNQSQTYLSSNTISYRRVGPSWRKPCGPKSLPVIAARGQNARSADLIQLLQSCCFFIHTQGRSFLPTLG